jgi:hypothetical protein
MARASQRQNCYCRFSGYVASRKLSLVAAAAD